MSEEILESTRYVEEECAELEKKKPSPIVSSRSLRPQDTAFEPHLKMVKGTDNVDVYIKEGRPHYFKFKTHNLVLILNKDSQTIGFRIRHFNDLK
jgi:hypothetical protein